MVPSWMNALMLPLMAYCAYDAWSAGWWPFTVLFAILLLLNAACVIAGDEE